MNVAHDQRDGVFVPGVLAGAKLSTKAKDAELAPSGWEVGAGNLSNGVRSHRSIIAGSAQPPGRGILEVCSAGQPIALALGFS